MENKIIQLRMKGLGSVKIGREVGLHADKVNYILQKIGMNKAFHNERLAELKSIEGELEIGFPDFLEKDWIRKNPA